jgi:hypothetical protein
MGTLYPRFRKWPPLLAELAELLDVKPPRRREDECVVFVGWSRRHNMASPVFVV